MKENIIKIGVFIFVWMIGYEHFVIKLGNWILNYLPGYTEIIVGSALILIWTPISLVTAKKLVEWIRD